MVGRVPLCCVFWAAVVLERFLGRGGPIFSLQGTSCQTDSRYYLLFREPKTRGRGARVQHVAIDLEPDHAAFIDTLKGSEPLFPGSPAVFRRRWDKLLSALEIPPRFRLTLGCLRGGGAYCRRRPIADIQWTMRLQNQATLAYYLQEVSAESVLPKLSLRARENVQAAASLLPLLLRYSPAH